ncbi:hypothetical protein [Megalodesulfovibrio gigas]|nr:hypothetical protein [Megalodesulfovibrio gigas]
MVDAASAVRAGLAAYQQQLMTVSRPAPAARVQEVPSKNAAQENGRSATPDTVTPDTVTPDTAGTSFRLKLGKLQISLFDGSPTTRDATQTALDALNGLETQADQAASAAFAMRQALAGTSRQDNSAASAAAPLALGSSSAPASYLRKMATSAYRQAELAWSVDPYRPGLLLGVF